jgi:hypothetical protein
MIHWPCWKPTFWTLRKIAKSGSAFISQYPKHKFVFWIFMCCNYWPVLQITDLPLVETRIALLNIPSPCLSWLSTMNSYARPGLTFDTVFWFLPRFVIFVVRHSGVSVARYLKPEKTCEDSGRKLHRKVMLSQYRSVRGPSGFRISRQSAHEGDKVVSRKYRPPLRPGGTAGTNSC